MVKNAFMCSGCNNTYLEKKDAVNCEFEHQKDRRKQEIIIEKNKKMVFSSNIKIRKAEFEKNFSNINLKINDKYDLIILMGNKGGDYIPYRCLLPHQVYIDDLRNAFEEEGFEVISVVGIKSDEVFNIVYKDAYGFQRWGKSEKKKEKKDDTKG